MVRSMTGYGKAEAHAGNKKVTVEVRTLNSKQYDGSVKLPALYRAFDHELRSRASKAVVRGKTDIYINIQYIEGSAPCHIDRTLFSSYYREVTAAARDAGMSASGGDFEAGVVSSVLRLPDVVTGSEEVADDNEKQVLFAALDEALGRLDDFRASEGAILIADILARVDRIGALLSEVEPYEMERLDTIRTRIRENLESLKVTVDENRFEQEIIYYVEKLDVTEEKVRLANHCAYFHEVASTEEAPGRKLGFIAQEMGREINTLGSKANQSQIQKLVVAMKDELEKIKEQLLNIL